VHWGFRVRVRRSANVTKGTIGGMTSNKMSYDVIETKNIIMELKEKHPFLVREKVISPKLV
jgi:hypothetical protein